MSREFSTRAYSLGRASLEPRPILKKGLAPNPRPTSLSASPQWWQGGDRLKNTCEGGPAETRGRRGLGLNCKIINCFPSPYPWGSSVGTTGHRCKSCIYKLFKKDLCEWSESDREVETSYDIPYMQNLKRHDTNELMYKRETDSQT